MKTIELKLREIRLIAEDHMFYDNNGKLVREPQNYALNDIWEIADKLLSES